jgi:hypothetical protein
MALVAHRAPIHRISCASDVTGCKQEGRQAMQYHPHNPPRNALPKGFDEPVLIKAIESSGYPLQGIVAANLEQHFDITEEWGYRDRDTKEPRSLDLFAARDLAELTGQAAKAGLILLIECKRSAQPFVFFKDVTRRVIPSFPGIAGLNGDGIMVQDDIDRRVIVHGAKVLGLDRLPFVDSGPAICSAFSKADQPGEKMKLSGEEIFKGLVLPLVKAFDHARSIHSFGGKPPDLSLILNVSILDAPMVLVPNPSNIDNPVLTPWVRLVRQEVGEHGSRHYGIDVVHVDFLSSFISEHILPFAQEFSRRIGQRADLLNRGHGKVHTLDSFAWDEITPV